MGNKRYESYGLRNLGWLSIAMGRLDEARADFDADLKVCTDASYTAGIVSARIGLALVSRFSAQPSAARQMLAQAREAARKMQTPGLLEEISLLEMSLDLDERQPARALAQRSEWTNLFATSRRIPVQVLAHSRLALALLADGRLGEASREAHEGSRLARDIEDVQAKAEAKVTDARVRAAAGDPKGALVALQDLLPLSMRAGRPIELEARLAIGELEKAQHTPGWQGRLEAMAESAKKEHFALVARRAASLLDSPN
jgi:tetratricopeptide (TPR) repeat protein